MILILLFSLIICISNATKTNENECFNVNDFARKEESSLIINSQGRMCDCNGDELKEYRNSITSIIFGENVTSIGQRCFEKFSKLIEIQFNEKITEIKDYAFYQSNIINVTIPKTITLIESFAFAKNNMLESIQFEEGNDELIIENSAFNSCEKLTKINTDERIR